MDVGDRQQLVRSFAAVTTVAACVPVFKLRVRRAGRLDDLCEVEDVIREALRSVFQHAGSGSASDCGWQARRAGPEPRSPCENVRLPIRDG